MRLSLAIECAEREAAGAADFVLTPDWLRERAAGELGLDAGRVRRLPDGGPAGERVGGAARLRTRRRWTSASGRSTG